MSRTASKGTKHIVGQDRPYTPWETTDVPAIFLDSEDNFWSRISLLRYLKYHRKPKPLVNPLDVYDNDGQSVKLDNKQSIYRDLSVTDSKTL